VSWTYNRGSNIEGDIQPFLLFSYELVKSEDTNKNFFMRLTMSSVSTYPRILLYYMLIENVYMHVYDI
jgi:hypothetical protein